MPLQASIQLEEAIEKLIVEQNISSFLFGNQGHFDGMALKAARKMKSKYPHISYNVVLAYIPAEKTYCRPMSLVKPCSLKGSKLFTQDTQYPGVINGWAMNQIMCCVTSTTFWVVQFNM